MEENARAVNRMFFSFYSVRLTTSRRERAVPVHHCFHWSVWPAPAGRASLRERIRWFKLALAVSVLALVVCCSPPFATVRCIISHTARKRATAIMIDVYGG